jgi:alpha-2-macroglobulin
MTQVLRNLSRIIAAFFVCVFLILLTPACSRDKNQVPEVQGSEAAIDARPVIEGFGLVSASRSQSSEEVALQLEFSQPLANAQEFDQFIVVKNSKNEVVKGAWVLAEDGKKLQFPHVDASETYSVLIRAGLTAADGKTLGKDEERKVFTGPLEPAVGFASQGSVLPARESRGLPVVSINVPEVDVEFFRVKDTEVASFLTQFQRGGRRSSWEIKEGGYDYDEEEGGNERAGILKFAESVYLNRFILGGEENERQVSYLPIQTIDELQKPGLYFAVLKRSGNFEDSYDTSVFYVSDIGLHVRAYKDKIYVHTASLNDGAALSDVEIMVLSNKGETVLKAETDGNGDALISYTMKADQAIIAKDGSNLSVMSFNQPALDLSEFSVSGREQAWFDVFAWSGRDLYRPGETLRLSALMRNADGKSIKSQPLFLTLRQPDGRALTETKLTEKQAGYFEWTQALHADAATGKWKVEFRTTPGEGDVVQGMDINVEEFLPERMKLELSSKQAVLKPGQPLELKVDADYLYGAPAAGNRFTARMFVFNENELVEKYKNYYFGDSTIQYPKNNDDVIDETLDEKGELSTTLDLPEEVKGKAPVTVLVQGSVYETGGRTVTRSMKKTQWPADQLIGVRPLFDAKDGSPSESTVSFELIRSNVGGQLSAAPVQVELVREIRNYNWNYSESGGWGYDYTSKYQVVQKLDSQTSATGNTKVSVDVEWGEYRLEVTDKTTGLITRFPFYAGWSWDDQNRGLDARPDKVKVALDKTSYKVGDKVKVTVTPPHAGPGVLIVEGDSLMHTQAIDAKPGATFEIAVTKDWERHDIYITALVFRGGSAKSKITPARAVGVSHVPINRLDRNVAVTVAAPKQTVPEKPLPITVKAPALAGKKAWVTISAVDVGILNITRFPVPDAAAHFFAQRRFGIETYDIYGRVIESYEGNTAKLKFGGDMALDALPQARRPTAKVQTVDLYSGVVVLNAKGEAVVNLPVPDFNGTLRVSALVFSADQYGKADSESIIRAPVVTEMSGPRALAPGDQSTMTVDIQNFTGKSGSFDVNVSAEGPVRMEAANRKLALNVEQKNTLTFPLVGGQGNGVGKIRIKVNGGGHQVNRVLEVPVRPAWGGVVRSELKVLDEGGSVNLSSADADSFMPGTVNARLTVSTMPPIPFARALQDLLDYPYGCAEQTTTRGYAALLLDPETTARMGFKGITPLERRQRLEFAISRLASMQISNGHFSYWGGGSDANAILTPYIAEFLLDAREAGFAVPETMMNKTLERLSEDMLTGGAPFNSYDHQDHMRYAYQAHSAYILARVNRAPLGTLRTMYDNERKKALTGLPLVHLGVALNLQGDKVRGQKAINEAFAKENKRPANLWDYGSSLRDEGFMLAIIKKHKLIHPSQNARLLSLSRNLQQSTASGRYYWLSTQEQISLAKLGKAIAVSRENVFSGNWVMAGVNTPAAPDSIMSRNFTYDDLAKGISFTPNGNVSLYSTVDVAGVTKTAPAYNNDYVSVTRSYYLPDGTLWKGGQLREGQFLIVQVKLDTNQNIRDALLVDLLPAGLEVENMNLAKDDQWKDIEVDGVDLENRADKAQIQNEEFRDDRYVAAIKLYGSARLFYVVRAVTPGTYTVPVPQVEDMYRPEVRGIGKAFPSSITVVKAK